MKKKTDRCLKCGTIKNLTRHHIFPRRHFGGEGELAILCRPCHDDLETIIPYERLGREYYKRILKIWLEE